MSFPKKLLDQLPNDFKDAANGMNNDELKEKLVEFEQAVANTDKDMKNDAKLTSLKEDVKAYSEGYKEIIKQNKAGIKYVLYLLEDRGAA